MPQQQARYFEGLDNGQLRCGLCPHKCRLRDGQAGLCGVRVNHDGVLNTVNYQEIASLALDPIEKKPLYHFYPGTNILSAGTFGCNLFCPFCQNYTLARGTEEGQADRIKPDRAREPRPHTFTANSDWLAAAAREARSEGSIGVAFTYNEPTVWFEYVLESAEKLQSQGEKVVLVTNGYIETAPLQELLPLVDAMNIDVKAFHPEFYRRHCRGELTAVMNTVEQALPHCHVEITTLLIGGENDQPEEIAAMARWLASLSPDIPLHLSRYYPAYRFTRAATPEQVMWQAREIAAGHLHFVYLGNLSGVSNDTCCLNCGRTLVQRQSYFTRRVGLKNRHCAFCGQAIHYMID